VLTLTAGEVAFAVNGELMGGRPDAVVANCSIDTRTLAAGDVFFAIRGERLDGEEFVDEALARGAAGVVTTRWIDGREGVVIIRVADTTRALQALARHVRRASGAKVVAITGSAGKTTTKEATAGFLAGRYRVFRNRGNLNNHIGLPLSLLALREQPEIAVVELGMNHAGEIRTLTAIAEPDVRVWTNVAPAHLEYFESVDAIADAKAEILENAGPESLLVANADDPRVTARLVRFAGRTVTFGIERRADVRGSRVRDLGIEGMLADLETPAGSAVLHTPLVGRGNLSNVLAATAVAVEFGVGLDEIVARAAALQAAPGRGEVTRLAGGIVVIDDSYNSNPAALAQALAVVARERRFARRVAVIGEMLELGLQGTALHEQCGRAAAGSRLDLLVTVGGEPARALGAAAVAAGLGEGAVRHVSSSDEAADVVAAELRAGDLVLVKGSRGVRTDRVVTRLKAEFA
jgi:UDP-N-acetylmuramoyl-tripeptide--D-alanyl-D-alanine ligase